MYQALYRKWRPQTFSDVVGQSAVTDTLKVQIQTGRLSHAYLFAGSRGTGKTTCAKILAKAVNCNNPIDGNPCNECEICRGIDDGSILDVIEIDAASNNGVDGVRELRDEAVYSPATAKKRVYIIDEVHMFTTNAFNALLKIMEEPPSHVLFVLATTELHKIPATVLSRCQRFTFKRITAGDIAERINFVAKSENISITQEAADFIARLADGGMRDALSVFDQCASFSSGNITVETVENAVGLAGNAVLVSLIQAIAQRDCPSALTTLTTVYNNGRDLVSVLNELSTCLRDILIMKTAPNTEISHLAAAYDENSFSALAEQFTTNQLIFSIETISRTLSNIYYSTNRRIDVELCIVKLCETSVETDLNSLAERIARLEKNPPVASASVSKPVSKQEPAQVSTKQETPKPAPAPVQKVAPTPAVASDSLWSSILAEAKTVFAPGIFALLNSSCSAELDGNTLYVDTGNPLLTDMLKERQYLDPLRQSAKKVLGFDIIIRTERLEKKETSPSSEFDALCDSLKDLPNITIK